MARLCSLHVYHTRMVNVRCVLILPLQLPCCYAYTTRNDAAALLYPRRFAIMYTIYFNPLPAKLNNLNYQPLEVVSRYRDPQLQVAEN